MKITKKKLWYNREMKLTDLYHNEKGCQYSQIDEAGNKIKIETQDQAAKDLCKLVLLASEIPQDVFNNLKKEIDSKEPKTDLEIKREIDNGEGKVSKKSWWRKLLDKLFLEESHPHASLKDIMEKNLGQSGNLGTENNAKQNNETNRPVATNTKSMDASPKGLIAREIIFNEKSKEIRIETPDGSIINLSEKHELNQAFWDQKEQINKIFENKKKAPQKDPPLTPDQSEKTPTDHSKATSTPDHSEPTQSEIDEINSLGNEETESVEPECRFEDANPVESKDKEKVKSPEVLFGKIKIKTDENLQNRRLVFQTGEKEIELEDNWKKQPAKFIMPELIKRENGTAIEAEFYKVNDTLMFKEMDISDDYKKEKLKIDRKFFSGFLNEINDFMNPKNRKTVKYGFRMQVFLDRAKGIEKEYPEIIQENAERERSNQKFETKKNYPKIDEDLYKDTEVNENIKELSKSIEKNAATKEETKKMTPQMEP